MTLLTRPVAGTTAPLARRNPVAKLGAALVLTVAPLVTVDPVTPALGLAADHLGRGHRRHPRAVRR
jgi:energy-coupling factor transport system permease protein